MFGKWSLNTEKEKMDRPSLKWQTKRPSSGIWASKFSLWQHDFKSLRRRDLGTQWTALLSHRPEFPLKLWPVRCLQGSQNGTWKQGKTGVTQQGNSYVHKELTWPSEASGRYLKKGEYHTYKQEHLQFFSSSQLQKIQATMQLEMRLSSSAVERAVLKRASKFSTACTACSC